MSQDGCVTKRGTPRKSKVGKDKCNPNERIQYDNKNKSKARQTTAGLHAEAEHGSEYNREHYHVCSDCTSTRYVLTLTAVNHHAPFMKIRNKKNAYGGET